LFAAARPRGTTPAARARSEVEEMLGKVLPDELSPREALDLVYALKAKLG
jgi:DNA mismatch repair protein MutS